MEFIPSKKDSPFVSPTPHTPTLHWPATVSSTALQITLSNEESWAKTITVSTVGSPPWRESGHGQMSNPPPGQTHPYHWAYKLRSWPEKSTTKWNPRTRSWALIWALLRELALHIHACLWRLPRSASMVPLCQKIHLMECWVCKKVWITITWMGEDLINIQHSKTCPHVSAQST